MNVRHVMAGIRMVGLSFIAGLLLLVAPIRAQEGPAPDFKPDVVFEGSDLSGFETLGAATWEARDGVVTGTAGISGPGGWLISGQSFQDIAFYARFNCRETCDAGVLFRAEKTDDGFKGILIEIADATLTPYRVRIGDDGQIVEKELARDPNQRFYMPFWVVPTQITPGWNSIEVFIKGNQVQNHLNDERHAVQGGEAQPRGDDMGPDAYGKAALYIGSGTVEFKDIAARDLTIQKIEPEITSERFEVQRLTDFAYGWGADVGDINQDGVNDFISGPFYYLGPDYLERHEYYSSRTYNPGREYVKNMLSFTEDFTGDGWPDILGTGENFYKIDLYVNPQGESRRWDMYNVLPDVCSEIAVKADIDQDDALEIIYVGRDGQVAYGEPDPANPTGRWLERKVSNLESGFGCPSHSVGVGDVNGDGRLDILHVPGWWEQPAENPEAGNWTFHEQIFGRPPKPYGGGLISVYDFNGDGLNDVVASLEAHGWGLYWYEQQRNDAGEISFIPHMIMDNYATKNAGGVTFSQPHAGAILGDIDRDGVMDFVTGKRHWAHLDAILDPGSDGEAVVYWYRTVRDADAPGGVRFEPELIHNKSGVGSEAKVLDVNGDGALDIIAAGTRGAFILWGKPDN